MTEGEKKELIVELSVPQPEEEETVTKQSTTILEQVRHNQHTGNNRMYRRFTGVFRAGVSQTIDTCLYHTIQQQESRRHPETSS